MTENKTNEKDKKYIVCVIVGRSVFFFLESIHFV